MPSFTSSSDDGIPEIPVIKFLGLSILITVSLLWGGEHFYRKSGQLASVVDSKDLWALQRYGVDRHLRRKKMVILGGSRSLLGIAPEVLSEKFPDYEVIHLAIDGTSPVKMLKDLAESRNFHGTVLVDTNVGYLIDEKFSQQPWIDHYRREWSHAGRIDQAVNMMVAGWLQERWVIFGGNNLEKQIRYLGFEKPSIQYISTRVDRYRAARYKERMNGEELKKHRTKRLEKVLADIRPNMADQAAFVDFVTRELKPAVERVRQSGNEVIFIRMPVTDVVRELENKNFPRELYWDMLVQLTGARSINFEDYPAIGQFDCPDSSHLDATDAPLFTGYLADIISQPK